jgi:formamidopyrimidine-DNA glycosylase
VPELPEVETIRRELAGVICGKRVDAADVHGLRSVRRHGDPADFCSGLIGRRALYVRRRGKYILVVLDAGNVLVLHLGMSGQLRWVSSSAVQPSRHTHVVVSFDSGEQLRFADPRTFGEAFVATSPTSDEKVDALAHLGFDALEAKVNSETLAEMLSVRRTSLKPLLMNQRFVAGLGNIYSDEVLFAAKLRYDRRANSLSTDEVRRLRRAITRVLRQAVAHGGSTLADAQYKDLYGRAGGFQYYHQVYGREGEACKRCQTRVSRVRTQGRSSFMCERCQG